jgi:hypothetical protein
MFGTIYIHPHDLLDTIIDGISSLIPEIDYQHYFKQLTDIFCLCCKYDTPLRALHWIESLKDNFVFDIYNIPHDENQTLSLAPFIQKENELSRLKDELMQIIKNSQHNANTIYTAVVSISTITAGLGLASLALLLLSPLQYFFIIGCSLIALGMITFAIGTIIQYFKQIDYQQDLTLMESYKLC